MMRQLPLGIRLRTVANFDNFYAGPNLEAVEAAASPSSTALWIWGGAASGKSHLLQAACAASRAACAYVPFATNPPAQEALEGLDKLALVCLDDLQHIAGKPEWERALFKFFNAAAESHARLILAASTAPTGIAWSLRDWASRAASCAVYQLRALDDLERIEALRLRAGTRGLELPVETAEYLLKRMPRDQRALFDLVDALDEAALAAQRRLTVPFVRKALRLG